jgi:hypothetical protein
MLLSSVRDTSKRAMSENPIATSLQLRSKPVGLYEDLARFEFTHRKNCPDRQISLRFGRFRRRWRNANRIGRVKIDLQDLFRFEQI